MKSRILYLMAMLCLSQGTVVPQSGQHSSTSYLETTAWMASHFGSLHGKTAAETHSYDFISMNDCTLQYRERETDSVFKNLNEPDHSATWIVPLADVDTIKILEKQLWTLEISTHNHGQKVSFQYEYMKKPDFQDTAGIISNADQTSIEMLPRIQKALQHVVALCQIEATKKRVADKKPGEPF
jgi:hypothetical protein